MSRKAAFFAILIVSLGFVINSCSKDKNLPAFDINSIKSFHDIPGITAEEIASIEALKTVRRSLYFGTVYSSEAFILPNGVYSGYLSRFCELLTELFGLSFLQIFYPLDSLACDFENGTVDFMDALTHPAERRQEYYMSLPIADRQVVVFSSRNSRKMEAPRDLADQKIGFHSDCTASESIQRLYPSLAFESIFFDDYFDAASALEDGLIDALICNTAESYFLMDYPFFRSNRIFPLVYSSVSLAARKPELEPVISVLNKYLVSGGIDKLHRLYNESLLEYARFELNYHLTNEEYDYLVRHQQSGQGLPIALEPDNYPTSFFNEAEGKFQGIAPDILAELSGLTGIKFQVVTDINSTWGGILKKLEAGTVVLVSEMLHTEGRKDSFLWSEPFSSSNYAFLSKIDYPHLEINQIPRVKVGIGKGSAYEELYNHWFSDNSNVKYYLSQGELLIALEKGEIDLAFMSSKALLYMANYREKSGYKINVLFGAPMEESRFGINRDQEILCSIICKAQQYIDSNRIWLNWSNRTFDYSRKMAETRAFHITIIAMCLSVFFLVTVVLLIINIKTRNLYKSKMITLSTIYKSLPDLVYSKDLNGKYTSCNSSFEEFVNRKESEIIGKTPFDVYTNQEVARDYHNTDKSVMERNYTNKTERWVTYMDNSQHLLEIIMEPLIKNGKVIGMLGISRDITDHKKAESDAKEASRAKSDFLARMSHEIRTPMNAITGMTELALRSHDLHDAQKHILTVKQASAHLLNIINDILDFSKIEKGKLEIVTSEYNFTSLINNVISIIRMRLIESEVKFIVNVDSNIPNNLIGDETRVRQVMLNVLINAVKYTEKGFISLNIGRKVIGENKINLIIEILDSGKGIKSEDVNSLFQEYVQLDFGKKSLEGVGLGLAITRTIVEKLGGKITVDSEYGKGSSFIITLAQKIKSFEPLAIVKNHQEFAILLYETRDVYYNSVINTFENLNLKFKLIATDTELLQEVQTKKYNYIFTTNMLYKRNRELLLHNSNMLKIVIMTEFGETLFDKRLNTISMPVYSISIANVLNGITDNYSYMDSNEQIIRFSAPDAKILVVDDINTNLKVAEGLMVPYQMKIDLCSSGRGAIEAVNREKYDIIFMDHKMPDIDGIEATAIIRGFNDKNNYFKTVPIIALTANAVLGTKEMFMEKGFNDFLPKPIDTIKLDTILEKWIPAEKKSTNIKKNDKNLSSFTDFEKEIDIPGVNVKAGIHYSGGNVDQYLETLNIFYNDCLKKIEDIQKAVMSSDYKNFAIGIHALKSALANIGASELSFAAKTLEEAANEENYEYINDYIESFISILQKLLGKIEKNLYKYRKSQTTELMDVNLLFSELKKLKKAIDDMNAGIFNKIIENLKNKSHTDNINASINNISDKILEGEYEEASQLIDEMGNNISAEGKD